MSNDSDFPSGGPLLGEPMRASAVMVEPMTSNPACAGTVVTEQVVAPEVAAPEIGAPPVVEPDESAPASAVVETVATFVPLTPRWARRSYSRSVAPDSIVATLVGLFVLLVGLLAVTRGGIDGPMDTPVVSVLGFTHTTTLGLIEVVLGGSLMLSGATRSRSGALFFGSVLGIAAFVGAVQSESFQNNLALESGFAWLMVLGGLMVVLAEVLLPRYMQRSTVVHPI